MADQSDKSVPLKPPVKNPHNVEATKYYIFNETGNIMLASTIDSSQPLSQEVQSVFSEVSVFYAGMSRAITTTINPNTGQPYSLYNYHALQRIISGSGLFVHVTEEDVSYSTTSVGMEFSKQLLESLLGLATGAGALSFASAMISSMGDEGLRIAGSKTSSESKVANIVFVCEYLLGMPIVSAIVVYADCKKNEQQLQLGPCFKEQSTHTEWKLHKDTYIFVTPTFIKQYAGDLDSIQSDADYLQMINWLSDLVTQTPIVSMVVDMNDPGTPVPSETALDPKVTYEILGQFLPTTKGTLKFASGDGKITAGSWGSNAIQFTVSGTQADAAAIQVLDSSGKVVVSTAGTFSIKAE
ncbi:MAG: hypothetical protein AAFX87_01645 [Bacteroidota bacterium]